jgi:hypothetical protein
VGELDRNAVMSDCLARDQQQPRNNLNLGTLHGLHNP